MNNKTVGIIIPTWNRPQDVYNALSSLVLQTNKDFEVYVSDDNSAEDVEGIVRQFAQKLSITFLSHSQRLGCGGNRELALSVVKKYNRNKYITFLDSDDYFVPHTIEKLVLGMEENNADIITSVITVNHHQPSYDIIESNRHITWLHGKMYRLQYLIDKDIHFMNDLETNEDLCFNLIAYSHTTEIYHLEDQLYLYSVSKDSITRSENTKSACAKCHSIDYIKAVYYAFKYGGDMTKYISSGFQTYVYYQNAIIFRNLTDTIRQYVYEILHHPVMTKAIGQLHKHPLNPFPVSVMVDDVLTFYGQTFGQWLMTFFTKEEIIDIIQKYQANEEDK